MPLIQITDVIPQSIFHESFGSRRALIGLRVSANDRQVAGIRALNPGLPPSNDDTYEVAFDQLMTALWAANKPEVSADWEVLRPHLVYIPYGCARAMHMVRIYQIPNLVGHPVEYLQALCRGEFLLDFDEIARYFASAPDRKRPPTSELPVLVSRIVTMLRQAHQWRAAEYWQSQSEIGYLPIPVESCMLYDNP